MTKVQELELEKGLNEQIQKVRDVCFVSGKCSACGVILEIAKKTREPIQKRLEDIIAYCERSLM